MATTVHRQPDAAQPPSITLWTLAEVATYLRVSATTLRRWTDAGILACYRIGGNGERRFSQEQVRAFLDKHERRASR